MISLVEIKKLTPKDIPGAVMLNERAWTVEKLTFGKDPSEILKMSSPSKRSVCENYFLSHF